MELDRYFSDVSARDWQTTDDVDPVAIAVVGLGWWAETFALPAIEASDFCVASTLVSGSPEKARRFAEEYDADRVLSYEEFHDGVGTDGYDAVYVVTPNALHLEYVESAAAHGKDVLCEKPLEATVDRARRMVETCEDAGVTLMTAYRMQADPLVRRLRDLLADGVVGEPVQLHGGFSYTLVGGLPGQWRREGDLSGGGALADIGVYPLNTARFLLDADPVAVEATAHSPDEGYETVPDEHVAFQLTFPEATTASFTASFGEYGDNRLQVVGTDGQLLVEPAFDAEQDRTVTLEWHDERVAFTPSTPSEVVEEFDYFAHCVGTGTRPEPDGRDGLTDMEVMAAVYESDENGERVAL